MLIGFFKKPVECICYVVKFLDRIWLSESGDVDFLRTFIVEVDKNSPKSLKEVRILIPCKRLEDPECVNKTFSLPGKKYYFNSPEVFSTGEYKIIQEETNCNRFDSYGIINQDGIKNIKVFTSIDYSNYQVGDCSVIRLQLPEGLEKGQSTEMRVRFRITSVLNRITGGVFPNYNVEFPYFSRKYANEIDQLDTNMEIKVKPVLGLSSASFKGGFDVFVYLPSGFDGVSGFDDFFKKKPDFYTIDGKKGHKKREKYLWRLREFLKKKGLAEDTLVGCGQDWLISGTLTREYNQKEAIDLMSRLIPEKIETVNEKLNRNAWLSYVAIFMSIGTALYNLIYFLLNR